MGNINDFGFPFTSVGGDRKAGAEEWREYFKSFTISGIVPDLGNELKVNPQASPNKTVYVDTGAALLEGAIRILESTTNLTIADNASGNPRIDRIVARLNYDSRKIELAVKQGTPAASPVAPSLTRDATAYEISLAKITLANGYTTITSGVITDERADTTVSGAANIALGVIPPSGADAVTIMLGAAVAAIYGLTGTDANVNKALEKAAPLATNQILSAATAALYGLTGINANADKALAISPLLQLNYKVYLSATVDKTFIVPAGVTKIYVWACAAGGDGAYLTPGKAGDYVIGKEYTVTPGATLAITVGAGNTVITNVTPACSLLANNSNDALNAYIFPGIKTGINGGAGLDGGGKGGAYGYGGGGAGYRNSSNSAYAGGDGAGCADFGTQSAGGVSTSGVIGNGMMIAPLPIALNDVLKQLAFDTAGAGGYGDINGGANGKGVPGGTGDNAGTASKYAGGGTAGGYGAGGGSSRRNVAGSYGKGSPGMVIIGYKIS